MMQKICEYVFYALLVFYGVGMIVLWRAEEENGYTDALKQLGLVLLLVLRWTFLWPFVMINDIAERVGFRRRG